MTRPWLAGAVLTALLTLTACVTINVYFPTAAAERAADRIIEDVWGRQAGATPEAPAAPANPAVPGPNSQWQHLLIAALDLLIAPAAAQQEPNIDIRSPEIEHLKAQMENRFAELKPYLDSGAVGLTHDGFVAMRDVPLAERTKVRALVANENADRTALYREIAVANKHPEWENDIRNVFARRWIAKAAPGWWHQDAQGHWKQR